jgi:flagellar basal body-associated protein FliL
MPPQPPNDVPPEVGAEPQPKKSILTSNLLAVLILFVIAMAELLVLFIFVLPSPATVKADIDKTIEKDTKINSPYKPVIDESMQDEERDEVDLGTYTFTEGDLSNMPFRLSVQFFGLVNKKDRQEYDKRYDIHKNRIRNAILVILRSSSQTEITDPSLGLIKNKIMVKVNEILGMPLVKGIIYTEIAIQVGG